MALTRKMLKAMGIEEEKIDQIIEAHSESVDALKEQRDHYKAEAEKLPTVQAELDALKSGDDYKAKYEKEKKDFDDYKKTIASQNAKVAKENAARSYFESKGIKGKSLDIAVRGATKEIDALELDGESIKDAASLDALVAGVFSGLVASSETSGARTENPTGTGTKGTYTSRSEIMKIKDSGERQKAIAENPQLFGM